MLMNLYACTGIGYKTLLTCAVLMSTVGYVYEYLLKFSDYVVKAVDVVAQAGRPKTITGFQTHTTPVLLAYGERAELATEECMPYHLNSIISK